MGNHIDEPPAQRLYGSHTASPPQAHEVPANQQSAYSYQALARCERFCKKIKDEFIPRNKANGAEPQFGKPYTEVKRQVLQENHGELVRLVELECAAFANRLIHSFEDRLKPYKPILAAMTLIHPAEQGR